MKTLSFELTMPNVGSWNGKWTGSDRKYFIIRKFENKTADKIMEGAKSYPLYEGIFTRTQVGSTPPIKGYYYNFGDGWGASITVEQVDAKEANKRRKNSAGFCGYDWMVNSIIRFDEILNSIQIKERISTESVNL
jgi:hypothetical protein